MGIRSLLRKVFGRDRSEPTEPVAASVPNQSERPEPATTTEAASATAPVIPSPAEEPSPQPPAAASASATTVPAKAAAPEASEASTSGGSGSPTSSASPSTPSGLAADLVSAAFDNPQPRARATSVPSQGRTEQVPEGAEAPASAEGSAEDSTAKESADRPPVSDSAPEPVVSAAEGDNADADAAEVTVVEPATAAPAAEAATADTPATVPATAEVATDNATEASAASETSDISTASEASLAAATAEPTEATEATEATEPAGAAEPTEATAATAVEPEKAEAGISPAAPEETDTDTGADRSADLIAAGSTVDESPLGQATVDETTPQEPTTHPSAAPEPTSTADGPEPSATTEPATEPEPEPQAAEPPAEPAADTSTEPTAEPNIEAEPEPQAEAEPAATASDGLAPASVPTALAATHSAAATALRRAGLQDTQALVYLVLDRSGSMRPFYKDGSAQRLGERALALAAHLHQGADPAVDVVFFSTEVDGTGSLTLDSYEGEVNELHDSLGRMGRTNYHLAVEEVLALHAKASKAVRAAAGSKSRKPVPALVIFQTDGAPESKTAATAALTAAANKSVFWKFVAFGEHDAKAFDYLRKLTVDGTGFFHAGPAPSDIPDGELFDGILQGWKP